MFSFTIHVYDQDRFHAQFEVSMKKYTKRFRNLGSVFHFEVRQSRCTHGTMANFRAGYRSIFSIRYLYGYKMIDI